MTGYLTPEDFNPRSYKRSDYDGYHRALHPQISIHAPTRGATDHAIPPESYFRISIHAPTRGATQNQPFIFSILSISIHAPTRGATEVSAVFKINDVISIHAPTRGATVNTYQKMNDIEFQSTLLQEERRIAIKQMLLPCRFQSTLLQEERLCLMIVKW